MQILQQPENNGRHPVLEIGFKEENLAYVIEASAGTGKTWTIERLFIKALIERQELNLEQILVVTFTNLATNELKARILQQLRQTVNWLIEFKNDVNFSLDDIFFNDFLATRRTNLAKDIPLLIRIIQNFDQASIYTIHGFCNKILQDYQVECNIAANFNLVSNKNELIITLIRDFVRKQIINNSLFTDTIDKVYANLNLVLGFEPTMDLAEKIFAQLPRDLITVKDTQFISRYQVKSNPNLAVLINGETLDKTAVLVELLSSVVLYIQANFTEQSLLSHTITYDELIAIIADRVVHNLSLQQQMRQQYPIAFIDEFQDTDALQWQIFSHIYGLNHGTCRGIMVVVGDPKQAIYQFRGADIDVYLEAKQTIRRTLDLTENRRSHPQIMNFINQLFDQEYNPNCFGHGIGYTHIAAKVDLDQLINLSTVQVASQPLVVLGIDQQIYTDAVQVVSIKGSNASEREQNLFRSITFEILTLLNADATLVSKIAILVTKNTQAHKLVEYLREYGVKACELKLGSIFATTTAQELYWILAATLDVTNWQLLCKAFATKLFNLPIHELVLFNLESTTDLNTSDSTRIKLLQKQLFNYQQIWQQSGIISVIYQLISDSLLHSNDNHGLTNRELSNLLQLGELLNKYATLQSNQLEMLYYLAMKIENADKFDPDMNSESEELIRLDNDDQQIVITTQHKAKGLEYDILFCPYFKADSSINNQSDKAYQLPFFARYRDKDGRLHSELIEDDNLARQIVTKHNAEIHRLNYVALTRAKSRLYLYLKAPSLTKYGKYNQNAKPDKLVELFGYVKHDSNANNHQLFNYSAFFSNPNDAIKTPSLFPGVAVYVRDGVTVEQLKILQASQKNNLHLVNHIQSLKVSSEYEITQTLVRQSYSLLTAAKHNVPHYLSDMQSDYFTDNETELVTKPIYSLSLLNSLSGAQFGVLFHELCENYPLSLKQIQQRLEKNNVAIDLALEFLTMLDQVFNYSLFDKDISLVKLKEWLLPELGFNLTVKNVKLNQQVATLLAKHYGDDHPYVVACLSLDSIGNGFLNGFIDAFFEYQGKYYILDYKTNSLTNYISTADPLDIANPLVQANASNHYYLQYLLYLVAVKRYLQVRLNIPDASHLLGGAVYYYVRGLFVVDALVSGGVYLDFNCQNIVKELDALLL